MPRAPLQATSRVLLSDELIILTVGNLRRDSKNTSLGQDSVGTIDHFRVALNPVMKARLSAKFLL